jgi:hypothetical protein
MYAGVGAVQPHEADRYGPFAAHARRSAALASGWAAVEIDERSKELTRWKQSMRVAHAPAPAEALSTTAHVLVRGLHIPDQ